MKMIFTLFITLCTAFSLVGCQNMSNQDVGTMTGAVAGGLLGSQFGKGGGQILAIGAGTVAGALIGGSIGKSMDDTDRLKMQNTFENNPSGQPAYWKNTRTGTTYTVVPTKNVTIEGNPYCREYRSTAVIAGKEQQVYGTACRQPDGSWKIVS
jgi:surface antigen